MFLDMLRDACVVKDTISDRIRTADIKSVDSIVLTRMETIQQMSIGRQMVCLVLDTVHAWYLDQVIPQEAVNAMLAGKEMRVKFQSVLPVPMEWNVPV